MRGVEKHFLEGISQPAHPPNRTTESLHSHPAVPYNGNLNDPGDPKRPPAGE